MSTAFVDLHGQSKLLHVGSDRIANEYIVIFKENGLTEDVGTAAEDLVAGKNVVIRQTWKHAVKGFFAEMTEAQATELSLDPRVAYVEENAPWYLSAVPEPTNVNPAECNPATGICTTVTDNRLWHLDRADQNYASPTNDFSYCTDGSNVTVYVVDGGVNKFHNEFGPSGARVKPGYNATGDLMPADDPCMGFAIPPSENYGSLEALPYYLELTASGHGTAVASVLGGRYVGVAKNVDIVPVKVIRCDYYSARQRLSNHSYQVNETIFHSINGVTPGRTYRAQTVNGNTAIDDPPNWPTTTGATMLDGGVTWVVLPQQTTTTDLAVTTPILINGLDWIKANAVAGPKVVSMSTYRRSTVAGVEGPSGTVEAAIRSLLDANITVVASANNQNGNACDTSPSRLSIKNPDPTLRDDVITAGGSMIINRPWTVDLSDVPNEVEADGPKVNNNGFYGVEPAYSPTMPVKDGRWICGAGDSTTCSNLSPTGQANPAASADSYHSYNGGSNAGPCVTLFAPAKNISVASPSSAAGYRNTRIRGGLASGTSWSAPIVAGFAARILQNHPTYAPADVRTELLANSVATLDVDTLTTNDYTTGNPLDTPNKLLRLSDVNITTPPVSKPAAESGTTELSVGAGGTSTLSYQWYLVNSGFDYATNKNGAHSSTAISGATSSTYNVPASGETNAYWVRVKSGCGSADSDIVVVVPHPAPPTNVVATASFNTVTISWSAASGAEKYEIQRKVSGQPWTSVAVVNSGTLSTLSYLDAPSSPTGMAIYRVLSAAGGAYLPSTGLSMSVPSNNDIANLDNDTYENLAVAPNFTTFKAQMLIELRQAANSLAAAAGISSMPYSSGDLQLSSLQGQPIEDEYLTDLMSKINSVRTNSLINIPAASWSNEPEHREIITRTFVEQLRNALQ